jgi:hypothetical protein
VFFTEHAGESVNDRYYAVLKTTSNTSLTTICPPHSNLHSMTHILPIAVGLKKASHEAVEKKFAEEIASLSQQTSTNEIYSKRDKRMVIVFVAILASLMDQPERRDMCCLTLGGSCFGGRWRSAFNIERRWKLLLSCVACKEQLLDLSVKVNILQKCANCSCFEYDPEHPSLHTETPNNYPVKKQHNILMELTFTILMAAVKLAHKVCAIGQWSSAGTATWLRILCLNKKQ